MKTLPPLVFAAAALLELTLPVRLRAQSTLDPSPNGFSVTLESSPAIADLPPTVESVPLPNTAPRGLMGGTPRSYNVEAWGGLLTPADGRLIAGISNVVDKARDGVHATNAPATFASAISVSMVFSIDRNSEDWPALTSWIPIQGTVRRALRQQVLPMAWDYASRHPFGASAGGLGPELYWMEKAIAAVPVAKLGRGWVDGALAFRAGAMEITSADRPKHRYSGSSDFSDYVRVWLKRTANVALAEGLAALMTAKEPSVGPGAQCRRIRVRLRSRARRTGGDPALPPLVPLCFGLHLLTPNGLVQPPPF